MRHTPFYDEHVRLGAKMADFKGWALPLQFSGIVREHEHTRTRASIFDCSHMGEYRVRGGAAIERYNRQVISDVAKIPVGRARYGAMLSEDGGVLDDLITIRLGEEELYVVTNAAAVEILTERLCQGGAGAENVSDETAKIDVQGPAALEYLIQAGFEAARGLKYFNACRTRWRDRDVVLSRTGYTGELGYELYFDNDLAPVVWQTFAGMEGLGPAGLGARDTLRLEMGYPLSGQDVDETVTPLESGSGLFVAWDTEFVGKEALAAQRGRDDYPVLVGIASKDRRAPRHGFEVKAAGRNVGLVTSGSFGPSVGRGIGLARMERSHATPGTALTAGPRDLEIEVVELPFYKEGTCRRKL